MWTHGDFIMLHPVTKNVIFLGRADGVLNPSGVRFGSAEIYSIIDAHFSDVIQDSICVGQRRPGDDDESVMLFLLMKPGNDFTPELVKRVNEAIKKEMSPRHVPRYTFQTPDIPVSVFICWTRSLSHSIPLLPISLHHHTNPSRSLTQAQTTVNLKKVELPVKQIVSGKTIKPSGTLLNPQSLDYYYQFAKVEDVVRKQEMLKAKL